MAEPDREELIDGAKRKLKIEFLMVIQNVSIP
jgi:hypothetical protein